MGDTTPDDGNAVEATADGESVVVDEALGDTGDNAT